jgi:hypothetical protein
MKRYLLFAGDEYYPAGGWEDFRGDFDNPSDAGALARAERWGWWQIVDITIGREIECDEPARAPAPEVRSE